MYQYALLIFLYKIACLITGSLAIYLGYRLFVKGIFNEAGGLDAQFKELKIVLRKAAPGTFFSLFGAAIIIVIVWVGLTFDHVSSPDVTAIDITLDSSILKSYNLTSLKTNADSTILQSQKGNTPDSFQIKLSTGIDSLYKIGVSAIREDPQKSLDYFNAISELIKLVKSQKLIIDTNKLKNAIEGAQESIDLWHMQGADQNLIREQEEKKKKNS